MKTDRERVWVRWKPKNHGGVTLYIDVWVFPMRSLHSNKRAPITFFRQAKPRKPRLFSLENLKRCVLRLADDARRKVEKRKRGSQKMLDIKSEQKWPLIVRCWCYHNQGSFLFFWSENFRSCYVSVLGNMTYCLLTLPCHTKNFLDQRQFSLVLRQRAWQYWLYCQMRSFFMPRWGLAQGHVRADRGKRWA